MSKVPLRPSFIAKKENILSSLSLPESEYIDLSPKGSIDDHIIPLIKLINSLDGLVTTSSCAGRISVFLEGRKSDEAAVGGKGGGGRWLFVSHDPIQKKKMNGSGTLMDLFGLRKQDGSAGTVKAGKEWKGERMVRFQFEPMVCI